MKDKNLKSMDLKESWVEAFKVGKVTDMAGNEHDFSEANLEELNEGIQGQLKGGYQPPLVKGHPKVDDPRVGSIVDSKVEGGVLKVKLDDVNPEFAEEVKKGGYKYLSASVWSNLKKGLRHLGALGAIGPAMKGMKPMCFGEGMFAESDKGEKAEDVMMFAESFKWDRLVPSSVFTRLCYRLESLGRFFRSQREQIIEAKGIEEADKSMPDYIVKDLENIGDLVRDSENFPMQNSPAPSDNSTKGDSSFAEGGEPAPNANPQDPQNGEPAQTSESHSLENGNENPQAATPQSTAPTASIPEGNATAATRLSEENAALKAENDALKADKLAAERLRASAAFSETLDGAIKEGRCNQTMKDNLIKVFGALQAVPVDGEGCFGEGDDRVNVGDLLKDTVASLPKIVEFGEAPQLAQSSESGAAKIRNYKAEQEAKGRVLTFAEAAEEVYKQ